VWRRRPDGACHLLCVIPCPPPEGNAYSIYWATGTYAHQACWEAFCDTGRGSPVPVSEKLYTYRSNTGIAKAGYIAGQSSFTAVPGRQHNCFPSALMHTHYLVLICLAMGGTCAGIYVINLSKTWDKLMMAARVIVAVENPQDVVSQSARPYGQRSVLKFSQYTGTKAIAGRHTPGTFTNQSQSQTFEEPRVLILTDPRTDHQVSALGLLMRRLLGRFVCYTCRGSCPPPVSDGPIIAEFLWPKPLTDGVNSRGHAHSPSASRPT
jgi:hypothetical protein